MNEKNLLLKYTLSACLLLASGISLAQTPAQIRPIHDTTTCAPDGIALGGYDAVSYHRPNGPLPGKPAFSTSIGDLTYTFASEANLNTFTANPAQYTPTYLGWCSATLSMGRLACPDYTNFQIEEGRLLLFERVGFTNGRDMWNADPQRNKQLADGHFVELSHQ